MTHEEYELLQAATTRAEVAEKKLSQMDEFAFNIQAKLEEAEKEVGRLKADLKDGGGEMEEMDLSLRARKVEVESLLFITGRLIECFEELRCCEPDGTPDQNFKYCERCQQINRVLSFYETPESYKRISEELAQLQARVSELVETIRLLEFECGSDVVQKCRDKSRTHKGESNDPKN